MNDLKDWFMKADGTIYDILSQIVETVGAEAVIKAVAEIEDKKRKLRREPLPFDEMWEAVRQNYKGEGDGIQD